MATDSREPDGTGERERLVHDLMTAIAVAKGNTQLLQRRFVRKEGVRLPGAAGGDAVRLSEGLERIDAALSAAAEAGHALIDHARAVEARASRGLPGPDGT